MIEEEVFNLLGNRMHARWHHGKRILFNNGWQIIDGMYLIEVVQRNGIVIKYLADEVKVKIDDKHLVVYDDYNTCRLRLGKP